MRTNLRAELSRGFWRRWGCAIDEEMFAHNFERSESEDDADGEVRLCRNCGLRLEFYDDDVG